jgi:hypothetical protein
MTTRVKSVFIKKEIQLMNSSVYNKLGVYILCAAIGAGIGALVGEYVSRKVEETYYDTESKEDGSYPEEPDFEAEETVRHNKVILDRIKLKEAEGAMTKYQNASIATKPNLARLAERMNAAIEEDQDPDPEQNDDVDQFSPGEVALISKEQYDVLKRTKNSATFTYDVEGDVVFHENGNIIPEEEVESLFGEEALLQFVDGVNHVYLFDEDLQMVYHIGRLDKPVSKLGRKRPKKVAESLGGE